MNGILIDYDHGDDRTASSSAALGLIEREARRIVGTWIARGGRVVGRVASVLGLEVKYSCLDTVVYTLLVLRSAETTETHVAFLVGVFLCQAVDSYTGPGAWPTVDLVEWYDLYHIAGDVPDWATCTVDGERPRKLRYHV